MAVLQDVPLKDSNNNTLLPLINAESDVSYTDSECKNAFLSYMAKKCEELGMTDTYYASPSGLTQSSYSTPQDALKLGIAVTANKEALKIWSTPNQSFSVGGSNARTISVSNNVISGVESDLASHYKFLGGKGGSLIYSDYHRAQILLCEVENRPVILSLMALGVSQYNNIYKSAKELCDMIADTINGNTPTEGTYLQALVSASGGYAGCVVPNVSGAYCNLYTPSELISREGTVSNAPTVSRYPASTSKTMTMLCALDFGINPKTTTITVVSADVEGGSGSAFSVGDIVTMHDALRIMMMESSNTMANAIARTVGRHVLITDSMV